MNRYQDTVKPTSAYGMGDILPVEVGGAVSCTVREIESVTSMSLTPLTGSQATNNHCFIAKDELCVSMAFVKILKNGRRALQAERDAIAVMNRAGISSSTIRMHGRSAAGMYWLVLDYEPMTQFVPSPDNVADAGRFLGRLHAAEWRLGRGVYQKTIGEITDSIHSLHRIDSITAEKCMRLLAKFQRSESPSDWNRTGTVLIHGDYCWSNHGYLPRNKLRVFDFEHSRRSSPMIDLANVWDRELHKPGIRAKFLEAYSGESCHRFSVCVNMIRLCRLLVAVENISYSRRIQDEVCLGHWVRVLDRIAEEVAVSNG